MRTWLALCLASACLAGPIRAGVPFPTAIPPVPTPGPTPVPSPGSAFERGQRDGMAFGAEVGAKKAKADGTKAGDRSGYAAGLKDAEHGIDNPGDPGNPPGGGSPPSPPPDEPEPPAPPSPPPNDPAPPPGEPEPPAPPDDPAPPTPPPSEPPAAEGTTSGGPGEAPADGEESGTDPLASADPEGEAEAEALSRFPEFMPSAPGDAARSRKFSRLHKSSANLPDREYTAGFAVGFAAGFAQAYAPAKQAAFKAAFARGYRRGQADWKRRNQDENGAPLGPEAQLRRALAEYQRGNFREAADRFDMVLAKGDAGELADDALLGRARSLFRLASYESAAGSLDRLQETMPDSPLAPEALHLAGGCFELWKRGGFLGLGSKPDWAAAGERYRSLWTRFPDSPLAPDAGFRLGLCLEKQRLPGEARTAYQAVIERFPDHPAAAKARKRLAALPRPRARR